MSKRKTFTITVNMEERWINQFCSFLKRMEFDGDIGHSEKMAFYADGDGDFSPKFKIDVDYINEEPRRKKFQEHKIESFYDAG